MIMIMIAGISLMYFTYSNVDTTIGKHLPIKEQKIIEKYSFPLSYGNNAIVPDFVKYWCAIFLCLASTFET